MSGSVVARLQGGVTFVTGGSRGIGASTAQCLAASGAAIAVGFKSREEDALRVVETIRDAGGSAVAVGADVSQPAEVERAFVEIERQLGPVDVLVNNAGIHRGGRILEIEVDDWRKVLDESLTSAFLCSRRAAFAMIERRQGRIINVSSVIGINGFPGDTAYASAKAGVIGFTKALALELAEFDVAVNAVAPGFVDTDMTKDLPPKVLGRITESIPLRRRASAEEIAEAIRFMALGPGYMTGSVLMLDGGWTIH